jgi:hypothetical protein
VSDELAACQATLDALRTWARAATGRPVSVREANATDSHARGYRNAARDALAIIGENAPVTEDAP